MFIRQYKSISHGYCPDCLEKTMRQLDLKNTDTSSQQVSTDACEITN